MRPVFAVSADSVTFMERNVPVVVITGTIGAGKSTVAGLASEILHDRGIRHGLLEFDALEGVYPPIDPTDPYSTTFALKNLATLWPNYLWRRRAHSPSRCGA